MVNISTSYSWDHPRACGEHDPEAVIQKWKQGSSPRMRGTPILNLGVPFTKLDHPRACGEHEVAQQGLMNHKGSSPRMRGTLVDYGLLWVWKRIIPAHAGNTWFANLTKTLLQDHPRACGEHDCSLPWFRLPVGSSPRMRGTPKNKDGEFEHSGIIPAHAGNTACFGGEGDGVRDHPRACGEHPLEGGPVYVLPGSSPRMRGTPFQREVGWDAYGIIPAHAGNTRPMRQ